MEHELNILTSQSQDPSSSHPILSEHPEQNVKYADVYTTKVECRALECWRDKLTDCYIPRTHIVSYDNLGRFLQSTGDFAPLPNAVLAFKALFVPRPTIKPGGYYIGLRKEAFHQVVNAWDLGEHTLEVFLNDAGLFTDAVTAKKMQILLKVPDWVVVGYHSVSLSYDTKSKATHVLYHGLGKESESSIFYQLKAEIDRGLRIHPVYFASLVYRSHQLRVDAVRHKLSMVNLGIEQQTGLSGSGRAALRKKSLDKLSESERKKLTSDLITCKSDLDMASLVARFDRECGNWLLGLLSRYDSIAANDYDIQKILNGLEFTRRRALTSVSKIGQLQDTVQSHTTLVSSSREAVLS
jgi:hypothetical protein